MITKKISLPVIAGLSAVFFLSGCGEEGDDETSQFPPYDNTEEVEAFYKADPERYVFAKPEDIPKDLVWENGSDLPDIGSPDAKKGGTLYSKLLDFPRTLRPVGPDSNNQIRSYIQDDVLMSYVHRHPNVDGWYPGIAEEWAVDRENNQVFIRINPASRWSDGEGITTEDTLFSFYFRTSDHTNAPFGKNFFEENYTRITIYDDYTFAVQVTDRRPDFDAYVFETHPYPRHFYIEHGPDYVQRYQWRFQPTTGAYVVKPEDVRKGRSITLTRNDNWWAKTNKYWRNRYNPDRVQLNAIRDNDKAFETFLKGDIDFIRLNLAKYNYEGLPDDHPLVQKGYIHKATFFNDIPRGNMGLWINTSKPPLGDINIRRGLHHASNMDLVIEKFFRGDYDRLKTPSDGFRGISRTDIVPREFSVEKALGEFAKAGFTERGADGILQNSEGKRLSFTISTGGKFFEDLLSILKQEARKAGVEFNLEIMDTTAGWKKVQEKKHEIQFTGFGAFPTEQYPRYWSMWHSDNALKDGKPKPQTNNLTITALPELDKLIDDYEKAETREEKKRLAYEIEGIIFDHAAWVPGVARPFYRDGYWRWIKWPEDFNVRLSDIEESAWLHWIDEDVKKETLAAMKEGKTFEPKVQVFDKYKAK